MPELPLEKDYAAARERLSTVYPDEIIQKSDDKYTAFTRFEGRSFAKSTLVHSTTGEEVGHIAWSPHSGQIISTEIDPSHRLGGANFGRLLHDSWKTSAMMNVAGPVHGFANDDPSTPSNRLGNAIVGDALRDRVKFDDQISDKFTPPELVGRDRHSWTSRVVSDDALTVSRAVSSLSRTVAIANDLVREAYETAGVVRRREPAPILNREENISTNADAERRDALARLSQSVENRHGDGNDWRAAPLVVPSVLPKSFSEIIGRKPTEAELRITTTGEGLCTVCNNHQMTVTAARIPYTRSHQELSSPDSLRDISGAVNEKLDEPLQFTVSSMAHAGLVHPLGHQTFTRSLRSVDLGLTLHRGAIYVNPEESEDGTVHNLLVRQVLACPLCR
jgi:hypothetical protein